MRFVLHAAVVPATSFHTCTSTGFREGSYDYLAVSPDSDRVFAPLRRAGEAWARPVLCFSENLVRTEIPLGALRLDPRKEYLLREAFSGIERKGTGQELGRLSLELPPYPVQVWMPK